MFYSVNILARKDGKFAVVWLAATKAKKLKRREVESVDVEKTCSDLMRHLPRAGDVLLPRSRTLFSLYLASQLMYGTIVIYDKQHKFLLNDLKQIIDHLKRLGAACPSIDMDRPEGRNIDMPDPLLDLDPLFLEQFGRPSPSTTLSPAIMDFGDREYLEVHTARSSASEEEARCIAQPASITLQEDDWRLSALLPGIDHEAEFPIVEGDFPSAAAIDEFHTLEKEIMQPPETPIRRYTEPAAVAPAEPVVETPYVASPLPPPLAPQRAPPPEPDVTRRPSSPRPRKPRRREALAFDLSPIEREPREPRRRELVRRRPLVDRANMIPAEEMNRMINNYEDNMRTHDQIRVNVARAQRQPAAWMQGPGLALGVGLAGLFDMNLASRRVPGEFRDIFHSPAWAIPEVADLRQLRQIVEQPQPVEEVQAPPVEMEQAPEARPPEPSEISEAEMKRLEEEERHRKETFESLAMPTIEPGTEVTPAAITTEATEQPIEEIPGEEPAAKRPRVESPPQEGDHMARCFPVPPDMPNGVPRTFALQREQLENHIYEMTSGGRAILFEDVCNPETATKAQAAKTFFMLLDLCGQRDIIAEQDVPYGPIFIERN